MHRSAIVQVGQGHGSELVFFAIGKARLHSASQPNCSFSKVVIFGRALRICRYMVLGWQFRCIRHQREAVHIFFPAKHPCEKIPKNYRRNYQPALQLSIYSSILDMWGKRAIVFLSSSFSSDGSYELVRCRPTGSQFMPEPEARRMDVEAHRKLLKKH